MSSMNSTDLTIQNRKLAKTCVEKKRRDRINKCLEELKDLIVQSNDKARYQKLEKAEILEMAVCYVKQLRQTTKNSFYSDVSDFNVNLYKSQTYLLVTFKHFIQDIQNYIKNCSGIGDDNIMRIINYITQRHDECISALDDSASLKSTPQAFNNLNNNGYKLNYRYSPYPLQKNDQIKSNNYLMESQSDLNKIKLLNYNENSSNFNLTNTLADECSSSCSSPDFQNSHKSFSGIFQDHNMDSPKSSPFPLITTIVNTIQNSNEAILWRPW